MNDPVQFISVAVPGLSGSEDIMYGYLLPKKILSQHFSEENDNDETNSSVEKMPKKKATVFLYPPCISLGQRSLQIKSFRRMIQEPYFFDFKNMTKSEICMKRDAILNNPDNYV